MAAACRYNWRLRSCSKPSICLLIFKRDFMLRTSRSVFLRFIVLRLHSRDSHLELTRTISSSSCLGSETSDKDEDNDEIDEVDDDDDDEFYFALS